MNGLDKYINRLITRNPEMADDELKLTITVASLKKQIQKAFKAGQEDQKAFQKIVDATRPKNPFGDIFKGM